METLHTSKHGMETNRTTGGSDHLCIAGNSEIRTQEQTWVEWGAAVPDNPATFSVNERRMAQKTDKPARWQERRRGGTRKPISDRIGKNVENANHAHSFGGDYLNQRRVCSQPPESWFNH